MQLGGLRGPRPAGGPAARARFIFAWGLDASGFANTYYSAAALARSESWQAIPLGRWTLVLPAWGVSYLVFARADLRRRLGNLAADVARVTSADWWVLPSSRRPTAQRPFIGGIKGITCHAVAAWVPVGIPSGRSTAARSTT